MRATIASESIKELIYIVKSLKEEGIDISKIQNTLTIDRQRKYTKLRDIVQNENEQEKFANKYGVNMNYNIGRRIETLRRVFNEKTNDINEEDIKEALELGIISKKITIEDVLEVFELLKNEGIDFGKVKIGEFVEGEYIFTKLKDIKQGNIDRVIKKYNLDPDYQIGRQIKSLRQAYNGLKYNMTDEEKRRVEYLGVLSRKTSMAELIEILEILQQEGVELKRIAVTKKGDEKREYIKLDEIKQWGVNINEIINKYSLDPDYPLGNKIHNLSSAHCESSNLALTEEEKNKVDEMQIFDRDEKRRTKIDEMIKILEILKAEGIDIRKITINKQDNNIIEKLLLKDIKQAKINIDEIIKKYNLDPEYPLGYSISILRWTDKEYRNIVKLTDEQDKIIEELGIRTPKKAIEECLDILEMLKEEKVNVRTIPVVRRVNGKDKYVNLGQLEEYGFVIDPVIEKYNLDREYPIGAKITNLRQAYRGVRCSITDEEKKRAEALGIVRIKDMQLEQDELNKKLEQAKELKKETQKSQNKTK